jgi:carboxylesterase
MNTDFVPPKYNQKEVYEMQTTDRGYKFDGGRTGVLLIHGLGGTPIEMRYVALALSRAGHTVSVPQLAGHCATEVDIKYSTWQDWYGSVDKALTELRKTCDTVVVGGLSAGAVLSLHLAANRPNDVQGVACYAPTLWLNGWGVPWYGKLWRFVYHKWAANMIQFTECEPFGIKDKRMREMVIEALHSGDASKAGMWSTPGGPMLELRWLTDIVRRQLPSIKQPTLLMHPREDDRADINNSFYLQRKLGGPVEMTVLDDCYHIVTIDKQRDVVAERTVDFTTRLAAKIAKLAPKKAPAVEPAAPIAAEPAKHKRAAA